MSRFGSDVELYPDLDAHLPSSLDIAETHHAEYAQYGKGAVETSGRTDHSRVGRGLIYGLNAAFDDHAPHLASSVGYYDVWTRRIEEIGCGSGGSCQIPQAVWSQFARQR